MGQFNTPAEIVGALKDAWGESIIQALAFATPVLDSAPFESPKSEVNGGIYHQPVFLSFEAGITHAAPRANVGATGTPFIRPRAGFVPDAQVQGYQIVGRSQLTYDALARTMKDVNAEDTNKKKAVRGATKIVMESLGLALAKRCEILALHGQRGLGRIEAVGTTPVVGQAYDGGTGTQNDVSINPADWSQFIYAMAEGSTFDVFTAVNVKTNTLVNAYLGNGQTGLVLIAVNPAAPIAPVTATGRVLRFWTETASAANVSAANLAAGNSVFFESGGITSEMIGLDGIGRNTGTLQGINGANFIMWTGNQVGNVGNVKMAQLIDQLSTPINYGIMGKDISAIVPTRLYQQFNADEAALRRYNAQAKTAKTGSSGLEFEMTGYNKLSIGGHPAQKDGKIICYVPEEFHRVGSQDVGFVERGKGNFAVEVADVAASELRAFGCFAVYLDSPKHALVLDDVTY